ncbi:hypothetical protein U1Q18_048047, partial [Sarracenia purpurea var. burkii]
CLMGNLSHLEDTPEALAQFQLVHRISNDITARLTIEQDVLALGTHTRGSSPFRVSRRENSNYYYRV